MAEVGAEISKEVKEYSFSEMRDSLWRLKNSFDQVSDAAYTDLAERDGRVEEDIKTGNILTSFFLNSRPQKENEQNPLACLEPHSEDRRVTFAFFGISEDMPWQEASRKIIYTTDHSDLEKFSSRDVVERTLQRMSNYKKLPVHTAEVTYRTYEQYIRIFGIDEEILKGKTVLDLGAGLSGFTEGVNNKFKKDGTLALGLDPVYQILPDLTVDESADPQDVYEQFRNKLNIRTNSTVGYYNRDRDDIEYADQTRIIGEHLKEMLRPDSQYVAGAGQHIPLKNESIDLIFSSNYLFRNTEKTRPGSCEGIASVAEATRVLKKTGQIFIYPAYRFHPELDENNNMVVKLYDESKSTFDTNTGKFIDHLDESAYLNLRQLQEKGITFYSVVSKDGAHVLVLRKDEKPPEGINELYDSKILKIDFSKHDPHGGATLSSSEIVIE